MYTANTTNGNEYEESDAMTLTEHRKGCVPCLSGLRRARLHEDGGALSSYHNAHVLVSRYGNPLQIQCYRELRFDGVKSAVVRAMWDTCSPNGKGVLFHDFLGFEWGGDGIGTLGLRNFLALVGVEACKPSAWPAPSYRLRIGFDYPGRPVDFDDLGLMVVWKDPIGEHWAYAFGQPHERDAIRERAREALARAVSDRGGDASDFTEDEWLMTKAT